MHSSLPPVAVVIPLHNGAAWIRETLASVKAQSHPPAEIVVVDDRSTDDGAALAAAVPGVTVQSLSRPSVHGAGPGRRQGFEQTTAPFVAFLDQDDLWHPDHLRLLATALAERPACPAAVAGIGAFNDEAPPSYDPPQLAPVPFDPWSTFPFNTIQSPSGVLVRRTALEALGGWPNDGPVTDFLTWYRLSIDAPFVENPAVTCAKRRHARSKTLDIQTNSRDTYLQYRARLLRPLVSERARRSPNQAEQLRVRLEALRAGGRLAAAYDSGSPHLVSAAAPALETLAATEPEMFDRLMDFLFRFLLGPAFRGDIPNQVAFLEVFLSSDLSAAPQVQRAFQTLFVHALPMRAFLAFLRREPLHVRRWHLGLASLRRALRERWIQIRPGQR